MREKLSVIGTIEGKTKATFGSEISEFLMHHVLGEEALQLVDIHLGVAALPCGEHLHVRPIMLGQNRSVLVLKLAQELSTLWIGFQALLYCRTYLRLEIKLV